MDQLVIGYGNPLRGDDRLGHHIAALLEADTLCPARILTAHQLTPELVEAVRMAARVVFVDARCGDAPGTVTLQRVKPAEDAPGSFTHHVTPETLLAAARAWYGAAPACYLLSVTGAHFELSETLSPVALDAVPTALDMIHDLLLTPIDEEIKAHDA